MLIDIKKQPNHMSTAPQIMGGIGKKVSYPFVVITLLFYFLSRLKNTK